MDPTLLRQKSNSDEKSDCFYCGEIVSDGAGHLRLACRCLVHYQCLVEYVVSWTYDRNFLQEWGIPCPYGEACEFKKANRRMYYISESELIFLKQYGEQQNLDGEGAKKIADEDEAAEKVTDEGEESKKIKDESEGAKKVTDEGEEAKKIKDEGEGAKKVTDEGEGAQQILNGEEGRKITDEVIENFRRFTTERCTRLDCGCYANYDTIVNHIKSNLCSLGSGVGACEEGIKGII